MPPPSSDKRKWWLDNYASSRVDIPKPPGEGWILNPNRPRNPFDSTTEPDWIKASDTNGKVPGSHAIAKKKAAPTPPPRRQLSDKVPVVPKLAARTSSSVSLDGRPKPAVPPKPSFISRPSLSASPAPIEKPKPALPTRPRIQNTSPGDAVKNQGLMDDDAGRIVGGWTPLQPSKDV